MRQKHLHVLRHKHVKLGALATHHASVGIAGDGPHLRHNISQPLYDRVITHIAGMPHLIAICKMHGKAVVPLAVRIAQYAYALHGL